MPVCKTSVPFTHIIILTGGAANDLQESVQNDSLSHSRRPLTPHFSGSNHLSPCISLSRFSSPGSNSTSSIRQSINVKAGLPWLVLHWVCSRASLISVSFLVSCLNDCRLVMGLVSPHMLSLLFWEHYIFLCCQCCQKSAPLLSNPCHCFIYYNIVPT